MRTLHIAVVAILAAGLSSSAFCQSVEERAKKQELVFMEDEEPAMRRAFEMARVSLDGFLAKAKNPSAEVTGFALKVGVREGKNTEYFWVNEFSEKDGQFAGKINNEPRMVKAVRMGQHYAFPREHIVDWMYIDRAQRRMIGNFTMCALLTKEPQVEAMATKKRFGLTCD
jgi:uncharacterized protein YegJ (DUF2314 family)